MAGVSQTNRSNSATADGMTTVFNFTFFVYSNSDVKVYSVLNDVLTPITTGITIAVNSSFLGGSVTFSVAPAAAVGEILIRREVPYTQTTELADLTRLKETAYETALNTLVLQIQQIQAESALSIRYNETAGVTDATIETPVDTAVLLFDGVTGRITSGTLASLSDSIDTVLSSLTSGDILRWGGSSWNNTPFAISIDTTPQLGGILDTNSNQVRWSKGADVASATALAIGDDGNYFDVTGTTTITSIADKAVGTVIKLHFDGALTLTHHATDLILPNGADIITEAGDEAEFIQYATGDWRCTNYKKITGEPIGLTSKSEAYTCTLNDANRTILHPTSDSTARTYTIPAESSVNYRIGTTLTFVNEDSNDVTIAITTDTLTQAGTTNTGSRTLGENGIATAYKYASGKWIISGVGLT